MMYQPVQFVSLGPGDPDLLTIKALKALQQADIIFYPATSNKMGKISSRALDILTYHEIPATKLSSFNLPMSKNRSAAIESYQTVADEIEKKYNAGYKTAIVAEGDAGFFSSIHYVYDYLESRQVQVKHIAGIPAFIACGALAGIHIVKQEEQLIVIPGTASENELKAYLESGKTVVIMKVSQCKEDIKSLISNNSEHTYHYFENAGVTDKEFYTTNTENIINREIPYFSLMIIKP